MRSGTFHIFSISGLHVGVIALALQFTWKFLRVPQRAAVVLAGLLLGEPVGRRRVAGAALVVAGVFLLAG